MLFCTCLKILGILEFRTFGKSPNLFNSPLALKGKKCKTPIFCTRASIFNTPLLESSREVLCQQVSKHRTPASPIIGAKLPTHRLWMSVSGFGWLHFVYQGGPLPTHFNTAEASCWVHSDSKRLRLATFVYALQVVQWNYKRSWRTKWQQKH